MARPTKYNDTRCAVIVKRLRDGSTRKAAAEAAGVSYDAFLEWLKRGAEEPESPFAVLFAAVTKVEAAVESEMAAVLRETGKGYDASETTKTTRTETQPNGTKVTIVTETTITKKIRDWRASESWLKRRRREDWGDNVTQDLTLHEDPDVRAALDRKLAGLAATLGAPGVCGEPDSGGGERP